MHEPTHLVQWKLGWQIGNNRVDAAVVLVVVAAMTVTIIVADVDNVGITTLQDAVMVATPLTVVETPLLRNEEATPRTTRIFVGAEPSNFVVPLPFFGRSC